VAGGATFAGTLDVSLVNGYIPQVNDSIPVITFDTSLGQFATVNVSNLPAGIAAALVYNSGNVTLLFGNALKANVAIPLGPDSKSDLVSRELAPVVAEAISRWAAAGVAPAELALLRQLHFLIADLPDAELGMQDGNTVWIDQDAAGHGWFLDAMPGSDQAFFQSVPGGELQARAGSAAAGKMDLLTVVEHEMGHVLGLAENGNPDGVMDEKLETGIRRLAILPAAGQGNVDGPSADRTTAIMSGLGQASNSASNPLPVTPGLGAVVDHLIESGEFLSASSIMAFDARGPASTAIKTTPLRPSAQAASIPANVFARRSPRFAIAGARTSRLQSDSTDSLTLTGGTDRADP
jgi:hypothetical protein